ncbi:MAG: PilZ domain-containing protein [Steroidobacteraceae bacterium]|nr:PilZ domain-containing protein [Steroidobacteraceae bacterium]
MERRLQTRHRALTQVYVYVPTASGRLCRTANLSALGVMLEARDLGVPVGTPVELAFPIDLGQVTKIHRRNAVVAHVSRSGTGLRMEGHGSGALAAAPQPVAEAQAEADMPAGHEGNPQAK